MNDIPANSEWETTRFELVPDSSSGSGWKSAVALLCLSLALIAVLLPWLALALQAYGLSPVGSTSVRGYDFMLLIWTLLAVPTAAGVGIVLLFYRRHRVLGVVLVAAATLGGASLPLSMSIYHDLRREKFTALAERGMPLVEAIKRYEADHGAPPPTLESLVPKYLSQVPGTGIGIYPKFDYDYKPEAVKYPWILYVNAGLGFLNWDMFLYLPGEQYPKEGWGGTLETMGRWAYVHE